MIALKYFLAVAVALALTLPAKAADDNVSITLSDLPPVSVIKLYGQISGTKVAMADEIYALSDGISLQIENQTRAAALKTIEEALAKQAGIEIIRGKDGSLSARKMKSG
jgi:hypothetical protein